MQRLPNFVICISTSQPNKKIIKATRNKKRNLTECEADTLINEVEKRKSVSFGAFSSGV